MKPTHALAILGLLLPAACSKETPPAAEEPRSPGGSVTAAAAQNEGDPAPAAAQAADAPPEAAAAPAAAKVTDSTFELELAPKGQYSAGQAGEAEILLSAKAPFHVNDKYPYKFKAKEAAGVKFAAPVTTKDSIKLETMKATMTVGFTPEAAGKHTLSGQFSFSVCTDDKCLIEKRDLALEITAN